MQSRFLDGEFGSLDVDHHANELRRLRHGRDDGDRSPIEGGRFRGWMWMGNVQPGLRAGACDLVVLSDTTIASPVDRSVQIEMLLHGERTGLRLRDGERLPNPLDRAQVVGLGETRHCSRELRVGDRHSKVSVAVDPSFLDHFSDALSSPDLDLLAKLMESGCHNECLPRSEMLIGLSRMIVDDPYCGSLGAMFRESALVQLLCQSLGLLREELRVTRAIGARHYDAVHRARELLDADIAAPPGTLDLARLVGLNRNALQAGFKAVFGTTVFGYVRDQRLAIARSLIQQHRVGAAEAGYRVGFRSASAFSAAYRAAFGRPPSGDSLDTQH